MKKKEIFECTTKCEYVFTKVKAFLTSPLVLTCPREWFPLLLYLSVMNQEMSSVFVQEIDKAERLVYFISKVFKGVGIRYYMIE